MNKQQEVFDPEFALQFVDNCRVKEQVPIQTTGKNKLLISSLVETQALFDQLKQPVKDSVLMHKAYSFISQKLMLVEQEYSSVLLQNDDWKSLLALKLLKPQPLSETLQTQENWFQCIKQSAVIHMTEPCWLQNTFQISGVQSKTANQCLALYLQLTKKSLYKIDLLDLYQALLLTTGGGGSQLGQQPPVMLDFAVLQLALACFPRVFFAEILGFTLAYCHSYSVIEVCFPQQAFVSDYFAQRQQILQKQLPALHGCIADYLACFSQQQQALLWQRIQKGFCLYQLQMQNCRDSFNEHASHSQTPEQAVIELFQQKIAAALGHHQKIQLQGKSLDSWFSEMSADPQAFLALLKQSDYVDINSPMNSRMLKLFAFKGPMFGVMDEVELKIIKNWLNSLATEESKPVREATYPTDPVKTHKKTVVKEKNYAKLSNRELYYYLLNVDLYPDVLATAKNKVRHYFYCCQLISRLPFKHYSYEKFDQFIEGIYQREMASYKPLQGKPKTSKPAYVWGLQQIAPMILIDGCWLQNSLALKQCYPEISEILFGIYCDEMGNGQLAQNHSYIFQQLLNDLSIELPPVHSSDFIKYDGFMGSSFDLPVYMLSLSCHTVEFLPELLGLNMAIELSGLGKGYMQLVDEWDYWGIDSTIAKIHISIDNAASGHTFQAKKSIQLYMDQLVQRTANQLTVDQHWERIYRGYASLRIVGTRFKMNLPINYLMTKFRAERKFNG